MARGDTGQLPRVTHNPALRGDQRAEKSYEVENCMEARRSRERTAAFVAGKTLGRQRLGQRAAETRKRERG